MTAIVGKRILALRPHPVKVKRKSKEVPVNGDETESRVCHPKVGITTRERAYQLRFPSIKTRRSATRTLRDRAS